MILIGNGMTQTQVAGLFGCSQNAVSHALKRRGISLGRGRKPKNPRRNAAIEMVRAGESCYAIADRLGVSHSTVSTWAREVGIRRGKGGGCAARNNAARSSKAAPERMTRVRDAIGERFEVVRETRKNWFLLRCRECGHEFERFVDLHYQTKCPECQRRESEQRRAEREAERMERDGKRALMQRLVNILAYEHVCTECGSRFRSANSSQLYCSEKCRKRARWKRREKSLGSHGSHVKRAKRYGVEYDRSITLNKLIKRDGMTCYICGKTCTKDDRRWGTFGPDYPTIDHVIPLCKGGTHTWDNVRIACGECNDKKGGSLL